MKNIRMFVLSAALVGPSAYADVFNIQGYVNFSATLGSVVTNTFGIVSGDSFTGTLTFDSSQPGFNIFGQNDSSLVAYGVPNPFITLTVQGQQFSLSSYTLFVNNQDGYSHIATAAGFDADPEHYEVVSPWGSFTEGGMSAAQFSLWSSPGFILPDSSLPTQLNIADWSTEHQIFLAKNFGDSGDSTIDYCII